LTDILDYAEKKSGYSENEIFLEDATTVRTLRNIRNTLTRTLVNKGIIKEDEDKGKELVEKILSIHGLSKSNFDFVASMERILSGKLNDNSIDDNSNKNEKSISGIGSETTAPVIKAIGYDYLYRMLVKLYGKKEAKRLTGEMYDFSLAISDSVKLLVPYCWAMDASKIVLQGRPFGQLPSKPPKRLSSYIAALNETIHQMSSHVAGALAVGTLFIDAAHLLLFKEKMSLEDIQKDENKKYIENCFQSFVHSVNHLSRNGIESPFTNISIFDRPKIKAIISQDNMGWYFDDAFIPDYIKEQLGDNSLEEYLVEYIINLQKIFTTFFDKGDPSNGGIPIRFPVVTYNFSKKKGDDEKYHIIDKKFLEDAVKNEIYRYNIYISEGTKVASCCFDGKQKVLYRNSEEGSCIIDFETFIKEVPNNSNTSIFHNGFWKKYKKVELDYTKKMYKITTENGKVAIVTDNHLFPTLNGTDKRADSLTTEDFLMFNTNTLSEVQKLENKLTYEQGYMLGCILGDGSFHSKERGITLSLNKNCIDEISEKVNKAIKDFGFDYKTIIREEKNNVISLVISNTELTKKILEYIPHKTAESKQFNTILLDNTIEARKGILDGWYATDGGNSNRCYTISETLIEQIDALCTTLGIQTNISVVDRTEEKIYIREEEYNRNYPLFCLRFYDKTFKSKEKNYVWKNNSIFFKIKDIELVDNENGKVYCVEIKEDEPYFTLPNGMITHNCRLVSDSEMLELAGQSNSFGGTSISLGSHRVITTNFNKVALEAKSMKEFWDILDQRVRDSAFILKAHKELIKKLATGGLQPFISNGWIDMGKMFSTFGIMSVNEAEITLREKFHIPKEMDVVKDFLSFFNERVNTISKENGIIGNIEQIPAESMAHRLVKADKLIFGAENVPYDLYSNQFIPLYEDATLWERIEKDGKYNSLLTGGGIVHFNLGSPVTEEQAKSIINHAVESGSEHFALNSVYGKCENGHVTMGKNETCPVCGEKIIDYYTRIIGYMTNVSSWNEIRRLFDFPNRKFTSVDRIKTEVVVEPETEKDFLKVLAGDTEVVEEVKEIKTQKDLLRAMAGVR